MSQALSRLFALCFLLALGAGTANATLVLQRSAAQLGGDSDVVAQGVVQSVESYWNADGTRILTAVDVRVAAAHKGSPPQQVRVVQMGGTLDGVRMTVAGALHWEVGEEILVFLEASERDFRVAGFTQGKFVLERDPVTRRVYATREALGATQFVQRPGGPVIDGAGRAVKVPVDQLLAEALPQIQEGN